MNDSLRDESWVAPSGQHASIFGKLLRALLPVAFLAAGVAAYAILSVEPEQAKSPPAESQAIRSKVMEMHLTDYPVVVTTNGVVQAHNEVMLSAEVSGLVTYISPAFEAGSYFSEGEILVEIDDRDYRTAVAIAQAAHLGAQAALELATQDHERNTKLFDKRIVSITEAAMNQSAATKAQAQAQLDSTAAQIARAQRDLERTKIKAPFHGRVRVKSVGSGQSIDSGTGLGIVYAVDFAEVRLPIGSTELHYLDLPELAEDPPVDVEFRDAINVANETVWNGTIVRTEGVLDQNSLELYAIARIDDPFGRVTSHPPLLIGQPVVGAIAGKVLRDVVVLPRAAVRQLDQIYLVDKQDLTVSKKTIETVWSDEDHIIVHDPRSNDGQLLATTSIVFAPDGAKIEIIPDLELTAATAQATTTPKTAVSN